MKNPLIFPVVFAFLAGCADDTVAPGNNPVLVEQNLNAPVWSNSQFQAIEAIDFSQLKVDTVVANRGPMSASIAADAGEVYVGYLDGVIVEASAATLQPTDSARVSADSGCIKSLCIDQDRIWAIDEKRGRTTRLLKIDRNNLEPLSSVEISSDTCFVTGLSVSQGEKWVYRSNPPQLVGVSATSDTLDLHISLLGVVAGRVEFLVAGRVGWILSGSALTAVDIDSRSVGQSYELDATLGSSLTMAACSETLFIGATGQDGFFLVHRMGAGVPTVVQTLALDTKGMFLSGKGSRLVAVTTDDIYQIVSEIDIATMTVRGSVRDRYCYGVAIE